MRLVQLYFQIQNPDVGPLTESFFLEEADTARWLPGVSLFSWAKQVLCTVRLKSDRLQQGVQPTSTHTQHTAPRARDAAQAAAARSRGAPPPVRRAAPQQLK